MGLQELCQTYYGQLQEQFFFGPPKQHATMPPEYKTEIDTTELCNEDDKAQYQKCIGEMQWAIYLGWIYKIYATVAIYQYLPAPHKGRISNIQHIYGHLKTYTSTSLKFNIEILAYDKFKTIKWNWGNFYYVELEDIPHLC